MLPLTAATDCRCCYCYVFNLLLLLLLQRYREVENLTGHYVFFLGAYRGLYIMNWIYRSFTEDGYRHHWIVYISGLVQTALYVDFFYYYAQSKYKGGKFSLPS
jgi:ER lumen protein retaining receptor